MVWTGLRAGSMRNDVESVVLAVTQQVKNMRDDGSGGPECPSRDDFIIINIKTRKALSLLPLLTAVLLTRICVLYRCTGSITL